MFSPKIWIICTKITNIISPETIKNSTKIKIILIRFSISISTKRIELKILPEERMAEKLRRRPSLTRIFT